MSERKIIGADVATRVDFNNRILKENNRLSDGEILILMRLDARFENN